MFAGKKCFLLIRILFWLLWILGLLFNILLLLVKICFIFFCWFYNIFQFWFVKIQFSLINPPDLPIVGAQILHWFHARITHQTWEAVAELSQSASKVQSLLNSVKLYWMPAYFFWEHGILQAWSQLSDDTWIILDQQNIRPFGPNRIVQIAGVHPATILGACRPAAQRPSWLRMSRINEAIATSMLQGRLPGSILVN